MTTRKRKWTKKEALEAIRSHQSSLQLVAEQICDEMLPLNFHDDETSAEVEKLEHIVEKIRTALSKLWFFDKQRKFRHDPEALEETFVCTSQYSLFQSSQESTGQKTSSLETFDSQELQQDIPQSSQKEYKRRPLTDLTLSSETRRRRVRDQREIFAQWCSEQGCTSSELAGLFIHLDNYFVDRDLSKTGWALFCGNSKLNQQKATLLEGIWVMERLGISYAKYTDLRLRFLDRFILPPAYLVSEKSKQMRPPLQPFKNGVRAKLEDCLRMTLLDHLSLLEPSEFDDKIQFSFNYGLDGSGQHSDYAQLSKASFSTKQVMNVCFALSSIKNSKGMTLWSAREKGHNCPQNIRPWLLFPSKESDELLKELIPSLDKEVQDLAEYGLEIELPNGRRVKAEVEMQQMSMCNGKMIVRLLQIGGSYCTMCHYSQAESHTSEIILAGFKITRSVETIAEVALELTNPVNNTIMKSSGDYERRQGITGVPITSAKLTTVLPVCHAKIQAFDWIVNRLIVKANSHKKLHSSTAPIRYSVEEKNAEKEARDTLAIEMKKELEISIGDPSEMTTGNKFKAFSSDEVN